MAWLQNLGGPDFSCFSKHVGATCKTDSHFQPRTTEQMPSAFSTLSPEFPNLTVFSGFSDRMKQCFSRLFSFLFPAWFLRLLTFSAYWASPKLITFVALTSLTGIFCPFYTFSPLLRARSGCCSCPRTQGPSPLVPIAQSTGTWTALHPR